MLYDVHLILLLVFLHIEHFSELLQLVELTEGFQNHQHGNKTKKQVTCVREMTASQCDQATQDATHLLMNKSIATSVISRDVLNSTGQRGTTQRKMENDLTS